MQFNNKIEVQTSSFNDFGESVPVKTSVMRCRILEENKQADDSDGAKTTKYDLVILSESNTFTPYNAMFNDDTHVFIYAKRKYKLKIAAAINGFNGKTKYYEIGLKQVK